MKAVSNLRDYGCGRVLRVLDSYLSNELTVESNHEILEHLERCPGCREELAAREQLRRAVRRLAAAEPGPAEGFEVRLRVRLRETPVSRSRPRLPIYLMAAAALLATGIGFSRFTKAPAGVAFAAREDVGVAVATQQRCTLSHRWAGPPPSQDDLVAASGPAYEPALLEMTKALPGFRVVAAHRCGASGTVLHFVLRSREDTTPQGLVSVLVTRDGGRFPAGAVAVGEALRMATGEVVEVAKGTASGFEVLAARHAGKTLAVVASASVRSEDRTSILRAFAPAWVQAG